MIHHPFASSYSSTESISDYESAYQLVVRMELLPKLVRRQQEEELIRIVPIESNYLETEKCKFLADRPLDQVLSLHGWSEQDLEINILRPEALRRFAEQRFGPGLEESFLSAGGLHDEVIYSLIRVRDSGLAQEYWIRLEEGETTFSELASSLGEGPEASRKGLFGPLPMGNIPQVEIQTLLRSLQVGQISPPSPVGEWFVLLRLEQLKPSRFDSKMRQFLLNQQIDQFFHQRVQAILRGEQPDILNYDISS